MQGRQHRAQKLAPAFLMVASALACGEVSGNENEAEAEGEPTTGGVAGVGVGVGGVTSNPPYIGTGGVGGLPLNPPYVGTGGVGGAPPFTGGAGGTSVGTGGFVSNPPVLFPCPVELPVDDSSCATGHLFGYYPPVCTYESDGCAGVQAVCDTPVLKWQVEACDGGASNAGGAGGAGGAD